MKLKKRKGELPDQMYVTLIALLTLFAIIGLATGNFQHALNILNANRISDRYMMQMESYGHGYLSQSDEDSLISDLENAGFTNIDLTGTTFSQVGNGDPIYLDIKYTETLKKYSISLPYIFSIQDVQAQNEITNSSTSKN